ncbi:unnamed protein product [Orchesella dallaii]|uniref:Uncharacterized protein n=1 Tax=Orchesella dallaii TaxID=48710 RepID=A0ABP1S2X0_9HEXA
MAKNAKASCLLSLKIGDGEQKLNKHSTVSLCVEFLGISKYLLEWYLQCNFSWLFKLKPMLSFRYVKLHAQGFMKNSQVRDGNVQYNLMQNQLCMTSESTDVL